MNLFRASGGDLLDIHSAFRACHQADAPPASVQHQADIKLFPDIETLLNQKPPHNLALRSGLVRNKRHTQYLSGEVLHFVDRLRQLYTPTLTASTGVDLRLYNPRVPAQFSSGLHCFINAEAGDSRRCGNAKLVQDVLSLILVNFHGFSRGSIVEYIAIVLLKLREGLRTAGIERL